jgi:hypothetical protein
MRETGEAVSIMAQAFARHKHLLKSNPLERIDLRGDSRRNFTRCCSWAASEERPLQLRITTPAT